MAESYATRALLERRLLEWAGTKHGKADGRDVVSIIVNSPDADGNPPSDATLVGQIPSLFAAAFEAGQSALTWTLLLLAQHPQVAVQLLDELANKMGRTSPSLSDAGELSYLDAVVRESMRILPPVPFQIRVAQCDTKIFGYPVPRGTRVIFNAFLTNRMPHPYPSGDVFRPERWFTIAPTAFEFPVFSGGPHGCIMRRGHSHMSIVCLAGQDATSASASCAIFSAIALTLVRRSGSATSLR